MKRLLLCLLLLGPLTLAFENKDFDWIPPTTYVPQPGEAVGAPLNNADIQGYNLYCNGALKNLIPNDGSNTWTSPDGSFPPGSYDCHLRTLLVSGVESGSSNIVNFTVDPAAPNPPTGFTVTLP